MSLRSFCPLIFTPRFYDLFRQLHNICVLREAHWVFHLFPVRSHALYLIFLAHFITKSNVFLHFYRKIECLSPFETKLKVFINDTINPCSRPAL